MIDYLDIKLRCSSCDVYFKNLPFGSCSEVIYIENEYHVKFNRYLRLWGWWLQKRVFDKYESGYKKLLYLPSLSKKQQHKLLQYQFPNITKEMVRKLPNLKTIDLLDYLEDPDDILAQLNPSQVKVLHFEVAEAAAIVEVVATAGIAAIEARSIVAVVLVPVVVCEAAADEVS